MKNSERRIQEMRYRIPNFTDRAPWTAPPSLVYLGEGKGIVNEGGKKEKENIQRIKENMSIHSKKGYGS